MGDATPLTLVWQQATVVAITVENPTAKTFRLRLAAPIGHRAGQHVLVRLTAPDGYTATRSYSVASAPDDSTELDLTVERLDGGEVSGYLHDVARPGDQFEVRGPVGGWFVWDGGAPAILVGGGSGLVPLMSMLRLARRSGRADLVRLVASVRSPAALMYPSELPGPETTIVHTRLPPPGSPRPPGRVTAADLAPALVPGATAYVCGSSGFADHASALLLGLGVPMDRIRIERFGPSS